MIAATRASGCVWATACLLFCASAALAQQSNITPAQAAASLAYNRGEGADTCPDEAVLKDAVHRQLGYAVFERTPVTRVIDVSVVRVRGRFVARLSLRSDIGEALGSREIESRGTTCEELASALGLAIALALDPTPMMTASSSEPAPTPVAENPSGSVVAECPAATPCPEPAACPVCPAPAVTPIRWSAGVGAALGFGALPEIAPALSVELGMRIGDTTLLLEGAVYPETSSKLGSVDLETQSQIARLGVCQWLLPGDDLELAACVLGGLGALRGSSPTALDRSITFVVTAGVRAAAELRLAGPLWLQARSDLHANLAGTTLSLGDSRLWETPALFFELALLGVVRFS